MLKVFSSFSTCTNLILTISVLMASGMSHQPISSDVTIALYNSSFPIALSCLTQVLSQHCPCFNPIPLGQSLMSAYQFAFCKTYTSLSLAWQLLSITISYLAVETTYPQWFPPLPVSCYLCPKWHWQMYHHIQGYTQNNQHKGWKGHHPLLRCWSWNRLHKHWFCGHCFCYHINENSTSPSPLYNYLFRWHNAHNCHHLKQSSNSCFIVHHPICSWKSCDCHPSGFSTGMRFDVTKVSETQDLIPTTNPCNPDFQYSSCFPIPFKTG